MRAILITLIMLLLFATTVLQAQPAFGGRNGPPPDKSQMMQRKDAPNHGEMTFKGYLIDQEWGQSGKDDTGKDCIRKPALVTKKHLLSNNSVKVGYGIIVQTPDRRTRFHKFDNAGNLMAQGFLENNCKAKKKIYVEATGFMGENGTISLRSIKQASKSQNSRMNGDRPPMGQGQGPHDMPGPPDSGN